MEIEFLPCL